MMGESLLSSYSPTLIKVKDLAICISICMKYTKAMIRESNSNVFKFPLPMTLSSTRSEYSGVTNINKLITSANTKAILNTALHFSNASFKGFNSSSIWLIFLHIGPYSSFRPDKLIYFCLFFYF